MTNIPVDWDCFAFKFSQNPRAAFENLATTLFCYEMHLPGGVFRYFNQPYIETQPVQAPDGLQTGFQAKYYDAATPLSSKENDLKKVITDAKKKYPDLQRILFYLNKEMSASMTHKVPPQGVLRGRGMVAALRLVYRREGSQRRLRRFATP